MGTISLHALRFFGNLTHLARAFFIKKIKIILKGEALLSLNPKAKYEDFMVRDLEALSTCTHIAMLEGWEDSKGAMREKKEAEKMGLEIMYLKLYDKGKK